MHDPIGPLLLQPAAVPDDGIVLIRPGGEIKSRQQRPVLPAEPGPAGFNILGELGLIRVGIAPLARVALLGHKLPGVGIQGHHGGQVRQGGPLHYKFAHRLLLCFAAKPSR